MHGLRIDKVHRDVAPEPWNFSFLFRAILDKLEGLHWIVQGDSLLQIPGEWLDDSVYDSEEDRYVAGPMKDFLEDLRIMSERDHEYFTPGLMPRAAVCVTEDGNELFGIRGAVDNLPAWISRLHSQHRIRHVEETAQVCFLNIDAAIGSYTQRTQVLSRPSQQT